MSKELVIVGVDSSETAITAAEAGARLAARSGAALHLVTAFDRHEMKTIGEGSDATQISTAEEAQALVERVASGLRGVANDITTSAALGKPHEVLVDEAERRGATLIVVGNRGMQGISRVLGSVANSVAHHAPCDVYIVKTV